MGFLDKAKVAATSAMAQGQAKVGAMQQSRSESELYRSARLVRTTRSRPL
jgi:hypothetical protein